MQNGVNILLYQLLSGIVYCLKQCGLNLPKEKGTKITLHVKLPTFMAFREVKTEEGDIS